MEFLTYLFNVVNGIMTVYIDCILFSTFADKRKFRLYKPSLVLITIIIISSLCFIKNSFLNLTILIAAVFANSFLYKMKWYNHFLLSAAIVFLSSFAELGTAVSISVILSQDMATLKTGYYFIIGGTFAKLLIFLIVAIIRFGKHTKFYGKIKSTWLYISFLPLTSIILVYIIIDYINKIETNPTMQLLTIGALLLLIITNVMSFYVFDKIYENITVEQNLSIANELIKNQKTQYSVLYESQNEIRKIKHDLKNTLLGLLSEIKNNNYESVAKLLETECNNLSSNYNVIITGNNIIDTIISSKKYYAESKGVSLNLDIDNLGEIYIDPIDLSVLFGNAIDNAIEATARVSGGEPTVDIHIIFKNSNLILITNNPIDKKIDIQNLSTTKTNRKSHGFGILQMKSLTQKYNGDVFFDCDEKNFKTTILINNLKQVNCDTNYNKRVL
ncbi:MAG: GHKL domain-containing protein [Clostridia bacterium]|nr:GHKL domain-containing protein [Clostridia bacterium]